MYVSSIPYNIFELNGPAEQPRPSNLDTYT